MSTTTQANHSNEPRNLCGMIDDLKEDIKLRNDHIQFGWLLDRMGTRVYASLLFLPAFLAASPLTLIPGISFVFAFITTVIVIQMLMQRRRVWMPKRMRHISLKKEKVEHAIKKMENPAVRLDKIFKPRLMILTNMFGQKIVLCVTLVLAVLSGPATMIPFANWLFCAAILILAMGLLTRDGILIIAGYCITIPPLYIMFNFIFKILNA